MNGMTARRKSQLGAELSRIQEIDAAGLSHAWMEQERSTAPNIGPTLLRRLLAYRLQETRLGGLPTKVARELDHAASRDSSNSVARPLQSLTPGSRLVREWQGRTITVTVTEDGFLWEGKPRRSLSEIARAVTGAHWSGPRFFGLTNRG